MQKMLRDAAVARYAERSAQLKEQQAQLKHERGRFAVRQQMKVLVAFFSVVTTNTEQVSNCTFVDIISKFL